MYSHNFVIRQSKMDTSLILYRLQNYAKRVGYVVARPAVLLYLVLRDPATSRKDKITIYAALAYLLLPIDLISARRHRLFGMVDEIGAIAIAYKKVEKNITPTMELEADEILRRWSLA